MNHIYEKHEKCEKEHCHICDGGLAHCTVCRAAEGELTTDCPGFPVSAETRKLVYEGVRDYVGCTWIEKASGHSPAASAAKQK